MGDVVELRPPRHEPETTNLRCKCGSEWWTTHVVFSSDMTRVTGWAVGGNGTEPRCTSCNEPICS